MSDVTNYTEPLSGKEVVSDVLAQIGKKLSTDCNLRATDGYSGGYSGSVTIKLNLHAVRITPVEMEIPLKTSPELKAPVPSDFASEDLIPMEVNEKIEIPVESNLEAVRDRTAELNRESESATEATPEIEAESAEEGAEPRAKRKYTRRAALAAVTAE